MFSGSNSVRTAELMLHHKEIAYQEVILRRGAHATQLPALGFSGRTVPALEIDGLRVQRTREISRALDLINPSQGSSPPIPQIESPSKTRSAGAKSYRTPHGACSIAP